MNNYTLGAYSDDFRWYSKSKPYGTYMEITYKDKIFKIKQWVETIDGEEHAIEMIDVQGYIYYTNINGKWCASTIDEVYNLNEY